LSLNKETVMAMKERVKIYGASDDSIYVESIKSGGRFSESFEYTVEHKESMFLHFDDGVIVEVSYGNKETDGGDDAWVVTLRKGPPTVTAFHHDLDTDQANDLSEVANSEVLELITEAEKVKCYKSISGPNLEELQQEINNWYNNGGVDDLNIEQAKRLVALLEKLQD
jgi:hypothetical protein